MLSRSSVNAQDFQQSTQRNTDMVLTAAVRERGNSRSASSGPRSHKRRVICPSQVKSTVLALLHDQADVQPSTEAPFEQRKCPQAPLTFPSQIRQMLKQTADYTGSKVLSVCLRQARRFTFMTRMTSVNLYYQTTFLNFALWTASSDASSSLVITRLPRELIRVDIHIRCF